MNRHQGSEGGRNAIVPAPAGSTGRSDAPWNAAGPSSDAGQGESAFAVLDDRLRGRWRIAIVLGVLLGAAAGVAGYLFSPVLYSSQGVVHVAPEGTRVLFQTEENERLFQFDTTLRTKASRIGSDVVILDAVQDLRRLTSPPAVVQSDDAVERIKERLTVTAERGSEFIVVTFDDESPTDAERVVNAILDAFDVIDSRRPESYEERLRIMKTQEATLLAERTEIQNQIQKLEQDNIGAGHEVLQIRLGHLADLQVELYQLKSQREMIEAKEGDGEPPQQVLPEDERTLARFDATLASLLEERDRQRLIVRRYAMRYNPEYPLLVRARSELRAIEQGCAAALEDARKRLATMDPAQLALAGATMSVDDLDRQIDIKQRQYDALLAEANAIQSVRQEIDDRRVDFDEVERKLGLVRARLSVLETERDPELFAGDADIESRGIVPRHPSKDRRKPMAAIGFLGGLGFSLGFFFLLGTLNQKTFRSRQFRASVLGARCLGVLPDLGRRTDPEVSSMATHCVHQIRNRIEASRRDTGAGYALMVSGPFQGDGKTSLAMSLAWSYANAGYRTLVVDADLIGRGLSHHLRVMDRPGLREAMKSRHVNGEVLEVPSVENLWVLGAGLDTRIGPESIRRDVFASICAELRERFDIILVDTGPFVGSVEILPVASSVDGVVLTVQRGRSRAPLKSCIDELADMQIPCLGVVLNQADRADCAMYVSTSLVSQRAIAAVTEPGVAEPAEVEA